MGNQLKHLLIILSFLLLSSPVIGDNHKLPVSVGKGETLYLWKSKWIFGIKLWSLRENIWKGFGDKKIQPEYKGQVKDGKPNGMGVLTYFDYSKSYPWGWKEKKYVGEWKDGKKHGQGTQTYSFGKYVGEWYGGRRGGQGIMTYFGRNPFIEGSKYVGEWRNGYMYGQGTFSHTDGSRDVGIWWNGFLENGIEYHKDGNIKWKIVKGNFSGHGTRNLGDGDKGVGDWVEGVLENGKTYDKNGNTIHRSPSGQGTFTNSDGNSWKGKRKDVKYNGQGTFTYSDGDKYVGEWKDGKYHGQGTFTFSDGGKKVGEYKDGKRWNGTYYDKDGNIIIKYLNGKRIEQ